MLRNHSLPIKQFIINEYGAPAEQQPGGSAWIISRLERLKIPGLRGEWAGADALHDYLANLLSKPYANTAEYSATGEEYFATGDWRVYQCCETEMTGWRVAIKGSAVGLFDVYATSDGITSTVKILGGPRLALGTWAIEAHGLSDLFFWPRSKLRVRTLLFDWNRTYGYVGLPVDMGITKYPYENDVVSWTVTPETNHTAYAFEFVDYWNVVVEVERLSPPQNGSIRNFSLE